MQVTFPLMCPVSVLSMSRYIPHNLLCFLHTLLTVTVQLTSFGKSNRVTVGNEVITHETHDGIGEIASV